MALNAEPVERRSVVDPVSSAAMMIYELRIRLEEVTSQLCGAQPPSGKTMVGAEQALGQPGLFHEVAALADSICKDAGYCQELLSRIQHHSV